MTTNLQKGFTDELKIITARSALGAVAGENFETATMDRLGKTANFPLRMFASFPTPNPLLNFEASNLELGSGVGRSVPPIESVVPTVAASSINFQTGVTAGTTFTVEGAAFALPTTTIGQYRRVAFVLNSSGAIDMKFSAANAVLASLENPGALFDSLTGIPIGWIDLEATAATAYKTAGSATAIIENKVSGTSRINIFGQLVAASGSGKGTVDRVIQAAHGFAIGDLLYLNGATYTKGIATSAAASDVVGMVSRVVDANTFEITLSGEVTGLTGLTAGTTYFLSRSVAGAASATEPNILGDVSVPVGVASSTTSMYVAIKRGAVVGAVNARSDIALSNNTTTNVQDVSAYQAGQLVGWIEIDGTTDYKFFVSAPFAKNGAGTDYNMSPQYVGDTPPVGFDFVITTGGTIRAILPNIPGFVSAKINYALNAPAVGTVFPLSIESTLVQFSTLKAKDSSGFVLQNSSGTQIASLDNSGNFSVAGNGQGIVPLGGILALASNITGSFAPPASGTVSSGWMRCDGAAIPSGGGVILSGNTPALHDNRFLMGFTSAGATGGNNALTPSGTLSGVKNIDHTHGYAHTHGTDSYNNTLSLNHSHTTPAHRHDFRYSLSDNNFSANGAGASMGGVGQAGAYRYSSSSYSGSVSDGVSWSTTVNLGTATVASVGRWYSDGDTNTASPTTDPALSSYNISHSHSTNFQSVSTTLGMSANTTVSGTDFTFNGSAAENRPQYLATVYLIRVK
jgi:hypothetical protein